MKITAVNPYIAGHVRNFFFVTIETDEGITGVGEGGVTWRETATEALVRDFMPHLIGQDPFRIEHLWQLLFRGEFFPLGRIGCAALSAIDLALWDIKGKALGVPCFELMGGRVRDRVVCYPHVRGSTREELVADAKNKVAEGWKFVRFDPRVEEDGVTLEPRRLVRRCIADFAAVREAVGPDIEIILDVHTRLDPAESILLCRQLEPYQPFFIEDPIRCENFQSFRKLATQIPVPLAAGEQYATKWEFRQQIEEELIDYARIDLCIVGGLTESLKVAHWCETHSIQLAPHNPLGPVSTAAGLHLDLACTNFAVQELARVPGTVFPELFPVQVDYQDGHLLVPTRPGLGVEFDPRALSKYPPITQVGCPQLKRPDGAFTNW